MIVSAAGETSRLATEAAAGLSIPPGDAVELASAVRCLRDDNALRERLAAGARAFGEANSRERGVAELERVLRRVVDTRRAPVSQISHGNDPRGHEKNPHNIVDPVKAVVTGVAGFIGSHLAETLVKMGRTSPASIGYPTTTTPKSNAATSPSSPTRSASASSRRISMMLRWSSCLMERTSFTTSLDRPGYAVPGGANSIPM